MDIVKLLPEHLDLGVDQEEMRQIALAAVAQRIREIKLSVAQAVVQARACTLMDNLEGSNTSLQQARRLQREYHEFYAQWRRLSGSENRSASGGPEPSCTEATDDPPQADGQAKLNVPAEGLPKGNSL